MGDFNWGLFDTAIFDDSGSIIHTLFQVAQGGDTVHTKAYTNMRGAGSLPTDESLLVRKISVIPDANLPPADVQGMFLHSYLEMRISDETVLFAPLRQFADEAGYGGVYTQAAAADEALIGPLGDGYPLELPLLIPTGATFRVEIYQGTALAGASNWVKCVLGGILSRGA